MLAYTGAFILDGQCIGMRIGEQQQALAARARCA
jgi:hypothetical protein